MLAFLSSLVIVSVEYVTAVPTNAKPAKNGHIFLPSRAAVRKNDSDAYGIMFVCVFVCDKIISVLLGKKQVIGERKRAALFFAGQNFFVFFLVFTFCGGRSKRQKHL